MINAYAVITEPLFPSQEQITPVHMYCFPQWPLQLGSKRNTEGVTFLLVLHVCSLTSAHLCLVQQPNLCHWTITITSGHNLFIFLFVFCVFLLCVFFIVFLFVFCASPFVWVKWKPNPTLPSRDVWNIQTSHFCGFCTTSPNIWSGGMLVGSPFKIPNRSQQLPSQTPIIHGLWGFGTATVGIDPTDFELDPTKIPPGGVVQNCPSII